MTLLPQEIPMDDPDSCFRFLGSSKPIVATPGALDRFGQAVVAVCLTHLQAKASQHDGLDYLQVFERSDGARLWFIEDGEGGAITALLPSDY